MKNLISIVIPIYNAEKYIIRCLESIRKQTYKYFEVIMVDDGSKDNSADLCKKICKEDNRFKYYYKENGGVSSARNYGIEHSKGEFISFIDSDDWIEIDFLETVYNAIKDNLGVDMSICGYKRVYADHSNDMLCSFIGQCDFYTSFSCMLNADQFASCVWNKLFRISIIEKYKLRFDTACPVGEDLKFCVDYLSHIDKCYYIKRALYNYAIIPTSAMRQNKIKKYFDKKWLTEWEAVLYSEKIYLEKGISSPMVEKSLTEKKLNVSLKLLALMKKYDYRDECTNELTSYIKGKIINIVRAKTIPKSRKVKGILAYLQYH